MRYFVVESSVTGPGGRIGTARVWVATAERATELASQKHGATWREVLEADVPDRARQERLKAS